MRGIHGGTWAVQGTTWCCAAHATGVLPVRLWSDLHACRSPTITKGFFSLELPRERSCCCQTATSESPAPALLTVRMSEFQLARTGHVTTKHVHCACSCPCF